MSDEKRRILEMVAEGRITQEDAARLLDALGEDADQQARSGGEAPQEEGPAQHEEIYGEAPGLAGRIDAQVQKALEGMQPHLEKLGQAVDAAVQEAGRVLEDTQSQVKTTVEDARTSLAEGMFLGVAWTPSAVPGPLPLEDNAYPGTVGGPVTQLHIDWVNGPVEVRPWEGDTIRVAEYASRPLKDRERMVLREKNGQLRIEWSERGLFMGKLFLQKHLVVELPQDACLERLKVENVSGEASVSGCRAGRVRVETASGPIRLQSVLAEELSVESVSGPVELLGFGARRLRGESVSGRFTAAGSCEELKVDTVSGPLALQLGEYPRQAKLESVSGAIELALPQEGPGFTVKYDSVSGRLLSQFPLTGDQGKHGGQAVYGGGGAFIKLNTVSGAMRLSPLSEPAAPEA